MEQATNTRLDDWDVSRLSPGHAEGACVVPTVTHGLWACWALYVRKVCADLQALASEHAESLQAVCGACFFFPYALAGFLSSWHGNCFALHKHPLC